MPLSLLRKLNFRIRVAILCGLFLTPLFLLLLFQAERARADFSFLDREIRDVAALRALWPQVRSPTVGEREAAERVRAASRTVILDPYAETYHLANALTSDLMRVARGAGADPAERARLTHRAAAALSEAAANLPRGERRAGLEARSRRLDQLAQAPASALAVESAGLWEDTARDLADLLAERRAALVARIAFGGVLVGGCVILGLWLGVALTRDLARRVTLLVAQIDRLIENDTSHVTPFLDDRHDMGRVAQGVEALRLSLIDARAAWSQVLVNEMRAALLSDHTRALVLRTDPEGVVVFTSPACPELDFDPDAMEGESIWGLFEPGDAEALRHAAPKAVGEVVARRRRRLARRFGRVELWDVELSVPEEDGEGLVFLLRPAAN